MLEKFLDTERTIRHDILHTCTLNKSSKGYNVYICKVFQKCLIADHSTHSFI